MVYNGNLRPARFLPPRLPDRLAVQLLRPPRGGYRGVQGDAHPPGGGHGGGDEGGEEGHRVQNGGAGAHQQL